MSQCPPFHTHLLVYLSELLETYGSEALRDSWWNFVRGDNPDGNMLRFVRARKGDVGRGLAMMATCLKWRLDTDVETLIANVSF